MCKLPFFKAKKKPSSQKMIQCKGYLFQKAWMICFEDKFPQNIFLEIYTASVHKI